MKTCVYLVGAGPGDGELITLRGLRLLEGADVVVYDYLSGEELLAHAPSTAKLVYVGKKGFAPHVPQGEINRMLVDEAREVEAGGGGSVVRLKGGDPFVFGRGGEEALALCEAGVPFEVVPGVTSGVAAAAYAGIPVTHRGLSSSVTFVTGHEDPSKAESAIDWMALAQLASAGGTLCFYMGMRNLGMIASRLVECGLSPDTPSALVQWGTLPYQKSLVTPLGRVEGEARARGIGAPAIILVGRVAGLSGRLEWLGNRPLWGRKVVVTRSRSQASGLSQRLRHLGADVVEVPTIAFAEPQDLAALDVAVKSIGEYDWAVFTSVNGVSAFFRRLAANSLDSRALAGLLVAAIGPATAECLREQGIEADVVPPEYRGEAVFDAMMQASRERGLPIDQLRVLIPRAQEAREVLPQMLRRAGARVDVVAAYRTELPDDGGAGRLVRLLEGEEVDAVTFTSSSTARNLVRLLGARSGELGKARLFSIGPITTQALEDLGFEVFGEAGEYTIAGLTECLVAAFGPGGAE